MTRASHFTAAALVVGGFTALASASAAATSVPSGELTTIRVTTLGFCDDPIVWGIDQGIFADHGVELELTTVQSGAAGIAALQAGDVDIVYANPLTSLQAVDSGIELQIVAGSTASTEDSSELIVAADSPIESAADLDGEAVAVNSLGSLNEILTAAWIAANGDGAEAEFVAIPFADQVPSVVNGTVAAAFVGATQSAAAHEEGTVRSLGNPFYDELGELPTSFYVADAGWVADNEEAAAAFSAAMTEVAASANDDANDEARFAVIAAACGSTPEVLADSAESTYVGQLDADQVDALITVLEEAEAVGDIDIDTVLPEFVRL